ncbi:MAG: quinone-dependent dihydroorotate dehydrogenase [Candidatus Promineifilaceae bacterium]
MKVYKRLFFPLIDRFDAERAHEWTLDGLSLAQSNGLGRAFLRQIAGRLPMEPVSVFGLTFPNVLGLAAGYDKDVRVADGLGLLGLGHIEVGTLTPKPQEGNPRPRIFRLKKDQAVINRMGFPNCGLEAAVPRLKALHEKGHDYILGVSLGKQKETLLEIAVEDYLISMEQVYPYCDYLAVNVSSPNTPELRKLQGVNYVGHLLRTLMQMGRELAVEHEIQTRPLLLKIAPDLSWLELDQILQAAVDAKVDGIIATNTTISRDGLISKNQDESGGLSGRPLQTRSNEVIEYIACQMGDKLPVIGVGGVFTADDVKAKLDAGAVLVQLYTGLVYEGPGMVGRILREL